MPVRRSLAGGRAGCRASVRAFDPQGGGGSDAAVEGDQGDAAVADAGVVAATDVAGVQAEVLRAAACGLPAQGDFGITGPDALHVGRATGIVEQAQVAKAAAVGEAGA